MSIRELKAQIEVIEDEEKLQDIRDFIEHEVNIFCEDKNIKERQGQHHHAGLLQKYGGQ